MPKDWSALVVVVSISRSLGLTAEEIKGIPARTVELSSPLLRRSLGVPQKTIKKDRGFILFHKKDLCDHRDGLRLICVSLERRTVPAVASTVCLMQKNELPDSAVVAFLKNTGDKKKNVHKLLKFLRKAKKTFRVVVLDVTNVGWDERCDFTIENCDLTQRMFKNLRSILIRGRKRWKVLSADKEMLKGALLDKEHVGESEWERIECTCCRECGVKAFALCLPEKSDLGIVSLDRLGWYMDKLVEIGKGKI